jgi:hypothetical protein
MTCGANIGDLQSQVSCVLVGIGRNVPAQLRIALARARERINTVWVAHHLHPARLGYRERFFGAPRNGQAFGWGDDCHDADGKIIGIRQTDGRKPRAAIAQCQKEDRVLSRAVQSAHSLRLSLSVQYKYLAYVATHNIKF